MRTGTLIDTKVTLCPVWHTCILRIDSINGELQWHSNICLLNYYGNWGDLILSTKVDLWGFTKSLQRGRILKQPVQPVFVNWHSYVKSSFQLYIRGQFDAEHYPLAKPNTPRVKAPKKYYFLSLSSCGVMPTHTHTHREGVREACSVMNTQVWFQLEVSLNSVCVCVCQSTDCLLRASRK